MKGLMFVVSSPTGAGKTTICEIIQQKREDIERVITHTTRKPREGEKNGIDYYFVSKEEFKRKIEEGGFVEYAIVHDNFYGTSKKALEDVLNKGKNALLAIDVQGAKNIMKSFKGRVVSIFILPPSFDEWLDRLKKDKKRDRLNIRFQTALNEFKQIKNFDFCVINDKLDDAVKKVESIIDSCLCKLEFFEDEFTKKAEELKIQTKKFLEVNDGNIHV